MVAVALAGCAPADAKAPGIQLSSERHGDDVTLTWQGNQGDVVVEFATEPDGRYTVLDFAPRTRSTYEHPDLMPATTFYYRVRPVEGPVSRPATPVPAAPVQGEDWLVPRTVPDDRATPPVSGGRSTSSAPVSGDSSASSASVHEDRPASSATRGGTPANLRVEAVGPSAVRLMWTDNATDEDGYLVEHDAGQGYRVVFVVDPDVNYTGLIGDTTGAYRVRAYHYGPGSNVVHEEIPG